jgi:hypothetical protein
MIFRAGRAAGPFSCNDPSTDGGLTSAFFVMRLPYLAEQFKGDSTWNAGGNARPNARWAAATGSASPKTLEARGRREAAALSGRRGSHGNHDRHRPAGLRPRAQHGDAAIRDRSGCDFRGGGSPWASLGTMFRSRTTYAYRVAGVAYQRDRISFGARSYASLRLLAMLGAVRFAVGAPVDVFYDPLAPARSVLTRGASGEFTVWLAALAILGTAVRLPGLF